jgi:hypothetical protein
MLAITVIERPENLHVRAKIGMPSIMNPINLPDMGRMNGNWRWDGSPGSSLDPSAAETAPPSCIL